MAVNKAKDFLRRGSYSSVNCMYELSSLNILLASMDICFIPRHYPVFITQKKFKNAPLFLQFNLPPTLICHENGAFQKRSSNCVNLKKPALRFCLDKNRFKN